MRGAWRRDYRDGVEDIDRRILTLLAGDGRMSFTDLARQTGLSVSATHQRVRRLERRGLIRGYAAVRAAHDDPPAEQRHAVGRQIGRAHV